jgi:hypothetical protein
MCERSRCYPGSDAERGGESARKFEGCCGSAFDATLKGSQKDGALDMNGVRNVLKLRAQFEGGAPADPGKYMDLSYYEKAKAGI